MDKEQAQALVRTRGWYHNYEVYPGVFTGGQCRVDALATFGVYGIPDDLKGKTVLDIGAWDGPYAFEAERRGAAVWALDIQDPDRTGFNVARQIKGSGASYRRGSVYEIPREWDGKFDAVLYLGVFYHLYHPLLAFQNIHRALKPGGMMYYEGAALDHAEKVDPYWADRKKLLKELRGTPVCYFVREKYANDDSNWFIPTHRCVQDWVRSSGFEIVRDGVDSNASRSWGAARMIPGFQAIQHAII
jgi:tRNA (mo5U34)-methyltransferase